MLSRRIPWHIPRYSTRKHCITSIYPVCMSETPNWLIVTANGSQDLTPEQKAHYGPIVRAHSPKTQPVYCPLLDRLQVS